MVFFKKLGFLSLAIFLYSSPLFASLSDYPCIRTAVQASYKIDGGLLVELVHKISENDFSSRMEDLVINLRALPSTRRFKEFVLQTAATILEMPAESLRKLDPKLRRLISSIQQRYIDAGAAPQRQFIVKKSMFVVIFEYLRGAVKADEFDRYLASYGQYITAEWYELENPGKAKYPKPFSQKAEHYTYIHEYWSTPGYYRSGEFKE